MRRDENIHDKILPNGVRVPKGLQVNESTLRDHRDRLGYGRDRMKRDDAVKAGYSNQEIDAVFGLEMA